MKNTKKIILGSSLFFALGASPALAETLWANDVSFSDGWTDITQAGDTCGPTTATNMIYWWLGQAKKDYVLPDSVNKSIGDLWKEISNNGWRKDYTYNALCDFFKRVQPWVCRYDGCLLSGLLRDKFCHRGMRSRNISCNL